MKDNFSKQSGVYAKNRPDYPEELINFILDKTSGRTNAWDCGTGNGQLAKLLSPHFEHVFATDISENQLGKAVPGKNIIYKRESAEKTAFENHVFDLVTVGQAIHWFDFERFYREVKRVLNPEGIMAVTGYGLIRSNSKTEAVIDHFYHNIIGQYWDKERRYVEQHYKTIPFPFNEIESPEFIKKEDWTIDRFFGYFNSWSAVQHYIKRNGNNPVKLIETQLKAAFGSRETVTIHFPIFLRLGKNI